MDVILLDSTFRGQLPTTPIDRATRRFPQDLIDAKPVAFSGMDGDHAITGHISRNGPVTIYASPNLLSMQADVTRMFRPN